MPPCSQKGCIALASKGDECALHAAGYRQHDGVGELRCEHCRRPIVKADWYQRERGSFGVARHVKACKPHPEVAKEQLAREAAKG